MLAAALVAHFALPFRGGHVTGRHLATHALLRARFCTMSDSEIYAGFSDGTPSEKQVKYAEQLAQRSGLQPPGDVYSDRDACSAFIDEALSRSAPSAKQLAFAESLARTMGTELPVEVLGNAKACSEYIDQNQRMSSSSTGAGSYGARVPTDKQLIYAASLARQNSMGLSYEVLSDRTATSKFIDEMLNNGAPMTSGGSGPAGGDAAGLGFPIGAGAIGANDLLNPEEMSGAGGGMGLATDGGDDEPPLFREGQIPF